MITVVVPCYNGEVFLDETIRSILVQSEANFELLIINDGSTDSTLSIAAKLASTDERIAVYTIANKGVSAARNFGLGRAKGNYIVFFDADDLMHPTFLTNRKQYLDEHVAIGLCGSEITFIDGKGVEIDGHATASAPGSDMLTEIILYNASVASCPSNFMIRTALLKNNEIRFNEALNSTADKFFLYELSLHTSSANISGGGLCYRVHENNMSGNFSSKLFFDNERFVTKILQDQKINAELLHLFKLKNYYMLAGLAWKTGLVKYVLKYGLLYSITRVKKLKTQ